MTITSFNHYHMVVLKVDGAYLSVLWYPCTSKEDILVKQSLESLECHLTCLMTEVLFIAAGVQRIITILHLSLFFFSPL